MEQEEEENMCDGDPGRCSWLSTRVDCSAVDVMTWTFEYATHAALVITVRNAYPYLFTTAGTVGVGIRIIN